MCDTPRPPDPTIARPRWVLLYGAAFSPLAALAVVEVATPPNAVRTLLRCILAMVVFAGMAVWVRGSRTALDMLDWCACAGATVSVRVIESERSRPLAGLDEPNFSPAWAEEERELALR